MPGDWLMCLRINLITVFCDGHPNKFNRLSLSVSEGILLTLTVSRVFPGPEGTIGL